MKQPRETLCHIANCLLKSQLICVLHHVMLDFVPIELIEVELFAR